MPGNRLRLVFLIVALLPGSGFAAGTDCDRVVFSAYPDYPPYHWQDGEQIVGASVALTGKILDAMGVRWEARPEAHGIEVWGAMACRLRERGL